MRRKIRRRFFRISRTTNGALLERYLERSKKRGIKGMGINIDFVNKLYFTNVEEYPSGAVLH